MVPCCMRPVMDGWKEGRMGSAVSGNLPVVIAAQPPTRVIGHPLVGAQAQRQSRNDLKKWEEGGQRLRQVIANVCCEPGTFV